MTHSENSHQIDAALEGGDPARMEAMSEFIDVTEQYKMCLCEAGFSRTANEVMIVSYCACHGVLYLSCSNFHITAYLRKSDAHNKAKQLIKERYGVI